MSSNPHLIDQLYFLEPNLYIWCQRRSSLSVSQSLTGWMDFCLTAELKHAKISALSDGCVSGKLMLLQIVRPFDYWTVCLTANGRRRSSSLIIHPCPSSSLLISRGKCCRPIFLSSVTFLLIQFFIFFFFIPQLSLPDHQCLYTVPPFSPPCCSPSHPRQQWQALLYSWYEGACFRTAPVCLCVWESVFVCLSGLRLIRRHTLILPDRPVSPWRFTGHTHTCIHTQWNAHKHKSIHVNT